MLDYSRRCLFLPRLRRDTMTKDTTDTTIVEIELDTARQVMYDELKNEFGPTVVDDDLEEAVRQRITQLYDNREEMRKAMEEELGAEIQDVE